MKPTSIIPKTFIGLFLLFSISAFGQTNQEKIQGDWKVYKYELDQVFECYREFYKQTQGTIFSFV